jgi:hypothetical protein
MISPLDTDSPTPRGYMLHNSIHVEAWARRGSGVRCLKRAGGLLAVIFVAPYSEVAALFAAPSLGSLFAVLAAVLIVASHSSVARPIDLP